jgi:hypothetical protein
MRVRHLIAVAAVFAVGFGVKLFFFPAPTAEANIDDVKRFSMDIPKMHVSTMLPTQRIHDMTLVFADVD